MTASDTREIVAFTMWKHEALRAAPNVGRKRTAEDFAGASDAERSKWIGLADAAIAAIPAVQVAVKPLEWVEIREGQYFEARVIGILYSVRLGSDGVVRWQAGHMGTWHEVNTIESAKAAAQADHEARIRSALTTQPSPDVAALVDDAWLLLDAYKAVLVLHRVMEKHGLTAGASAAENIADRIVAAHPEFPGLSALRGAALALVKGGA